MESISFSFWQVFQPGVLALSASGAIIGIIVGALPGLTSTMGMALMLPIVFQLPTVPGLALLTSVHAGAVAGASIPAILIGIPGNPNAIMTTEDGLKMTKKGLAGQALGGSVLSSFFGGIGSLIILALLVPFLAAFTLRFGPAELAATYFFGLTVIISVSGKNLSKGLVTGILGMMLALFGSDSITNTIRLPFPDVLSRTPLASGIGLIPALIGVFGISQVLIDMEHVNEGALAPPQVALNRIFPPLKKLVSMWRIFLESLGIGTLIGAIPGTGASIASFITYGRAKSLAASPKNKLDEPGTGVIEGVVAPEVAVNAVIGGALVPVLALGIPGDSSSAVLLGALLVQGVVPGYQLFSTDIGLVYSLYGLLVLANIFMFSFQLLGIRIYPKVLRVQMSLLLPIVLSLSLIGAFALRGQAVLAGTSDMGIALGLGILSYFLKKAEYPLAPIILGLILGGPFEQELRRALQLSRGNFSIFFTSPIALVLIIIGIVSLSYPLISRLLRERKQRRARG